MTTAETTTRRTFLTAGVATAGAAAGVVALTACGSSGGSASAGSTGSQAPATTSGTVVAAVSDVPVGQAKSVTLAGQPAVVARPSATQAVAFSAICTHQSCTVTPGGNKLNCPCHGSQFNAFTGAVEHGPARQPLPAIPVKIDNDKIVTA